MKLTIELDFPDESGLDERDHLPRQRLYEELQMAVKDTCKSYGYAAELVDCKVELDTDKWNKSLVSPFSLVLSTPEDQRVECLLGAVDELCELEHSYKKEEVWAEERQKIRDERQITAYEYSDEREGR